MKSFLLIGQSNIAGRGDFGEVPEIVNARGDGIHFNSASYRIFGMRYFKKYLETLAL